MQRLGEPEPDASGAFEHLRDPVVLLLLGAVALHHQHGREVADDRALILQIVVQSEPLRCEVLPNDRHPEVRSVAASEASGKVVAEVSGGIGSTAHLAEQRFPLLVRPAVTLPVGAGILAPVVEEPDVVVLAFERLDLVFDELVELVEQLLDVGRNGEVHGNACYGPGRPARHPATPIGVGADRAWRWSHCHRPRRRVL